MKDTLLRAQITRELLLYIRDMRPTPDAFVEWLGPMEAGRFHILKKAGLLIVHDGIVRLAPNHTDQDETRFCCGNALYCLDQDRVDFYRRQKNSDGTFDELLPSRHLNSA